MAIAVDCEAQPQPAVPALQPMGQFTYPGYTTSTPDPVERAQNAPDELAEQRETPPQTEKKRTVQDGCEPVSEARGAFASELFAQLNSLKNEMYNKIEVLGVHIHYVDGENQKLKGKVQDVECENQKLKGKIQDVECENPRLGDENRRLDGKVQRLDGKVQRLEGEVQELKSDNKDKSVMLEFLKTQRNHLIKRESLRGFYRAFGHQINTLRTPTHKYLLTQGPLLQKIFTLSRKEANDLLAFLNSTRLTTQGNDAAHHFTLADAMAAVGENEPPLRKFVEFLVQRYGEDTEIAQAAEQLEEELAAENEMEVEDWRNKCNLTSN